jgi:hypothetical protein
MKKTILLSMALGLASAASLTAGTVDIFLTGSTAFRSQVYNAAVKCFNAAPNIYYGDSAHGGAGSGFSSSTAAWVMTGTPITAMTNVYGVGNLPSSTTLKIHGLFTGSVQGIQTVVQGVQLVFPKDVGTAGANCTDYVTNTPTIGFSDCASPSTPYNVANISGFAEESVAIQPFVWCVCNADAAKTNILNMSSELAFHGIPTGYLPLSAWTGKNSDTNYNVYVAQRTKDSGTRRVETALANYSFNDTVNTYIYNTNSHSWYAPSSLTSGLLGDGTVGVVGAAGLNNANLNWGYGYVGGGDLRTALSLATGVTNLGLGMLSLADAKSLGSSNWANVVSLNGFWPTTAGIGLRGNSVTNDFSPVKNGYYPAWAEETIVYSTSQSGVSDSKITDTQLGTGTAVATFLGTFNAHNYAAPVAGSVDNEIFVSQSVGGTGYPATAIRLGDMKCNRAAVGGEITPY